MAERIAEIVILAEDAHQSNLARRYLQRKGHNPRTIRVRVPRSGRGSGEQHVREQYPAEVGHYREASHRRKAALIVATDADTKTTSGRERELETALLEAGEGRRSPDEAIALLIPKRNIETWILCLVGESVDETTDYKGRKDVGELIKDAANALFDWSRPHCNVPPRCVPSLQQGLHEIARIG